MILILALALIMVDGKVYKENKRKKIEEKYYYVQVVHIIITPRLQPSVIKNALKTSSTCLLFFSLLLSNDNLQKKID